MASRYNDTGLVRIRNARRGTVTCLAPFNLDALTDDTFFVYQVKQGETFEVLAAKFYKDSSKWWLILQANRNNSKLLFPLNLSAGDTIHIPSPSIASRI